MKLNFKWFGSKYCFRKRTFYGGMLFVLIYGLFLTACDTTDGMLPAKGRVFIKLFGGYGSEEGKDMVALSDGGFAMTGYSTSNTSGGKDVFVVRTDANGNLLWQKQYGRSGDDIGNSIINASDGNLIVCGESTQVNGNDQTLRDVYVLKISISDGALIRENFYGDSLRDEIGTSVLETSTNGFLITSTWSNRDTSEFYMIEADADLVPLDKSSRYVAGIKGVNNFSLKTFLNTGNALNPFLCFGTVYNSLPGINSFYFQAFEYRSLGNQTPKAELFGNVNSNDLCTDVCITTDGGFALAGESDDGNIKKEMVIKINNNRKEIWKMEIPNEFDRNTSNTKIYQTKDGGFVIASTIQLDDPLNDEISLTKLDFTGQLQWRKTFGSPDDDQSGKVIQLEDGSFIVVATIGFSINPDSNSKMGLFKLNSNGELILM